MTTTAPQQATVRKEVGGFLVVGVLAVAGFEILVLA